MESEWKLKFVDLPGEEIGNWQSSRIELAEHEFAPHPCNALRTSRLSAGKNSVPLAGPAEQSISTAVATGRLHASRVGDKDRMKQQSSH